MWNSGMMFRPQSAAVNFSVARMFCAEAARLRCDSGTILGREVVPEVCSTIDTSSGREWPPSAATRDGASSRGWSRKLPAGTPASTTRSRMRTPSLRATSMAGEWLAFSTIRALAWRSDR